MNITTPAARWRALAMLSAIFGAGVSVYLLVEYTTGQAGVCLTGSGCDEVRASQFAYPLGIPMPLFGVAFYLLAAWLSYRTLADGRILGLAPRTALLLAGLAGVGMSAVLTGLEAFVIGAFCTWCLASAAASLVLLGGALGLAMSRDPEPMPGQSSRARQQRARTEESQRSSFLRLGTWAASLTALLFAGLLVAGAAGSGPGPQQSGDNLAPAGSPRLGTGAVTVVEFSDFQCPGCAAVAPLLNSLAASNEVTLVYRYYPLDSIHANANASARAADAAKLQGGFWAMAELIFARQSAWANLSAAAADEYFAGLAGAIGLDVSTWTADYTSQAVRDAVTFDAAAARDLSLSSTPSIFIGGELYRGSLSLDELRAAVARAAARQLPAS